MIRNFPESSKAGRQHLETGNESKTGLLTMSTEFSHVNDAAIGPDIHRCVDRKVQVCV